MELSIHPNSFQSRHYWGGARLDGNASVEGAVSQGVGDCPVEFPNAQVYGQVVARVDLEPCDESAGDYPGLLAYSGVDIGGVVG